MTEFWEIAFQNNKVMWGLTPARSALAARDLFVQYGAKNVLVPGFGYGRNAHVFRESGMSVTGIEISQTAIERARQYYGEDMKIHHGSISDMPFDAEKYNGIYCYALLHLLDSSGRAKLIVDCYNQLSSGGHMVFVTIAKSDARYAKGTQFGEDRFEPFKGVQLYFYDKESVQREFASFGLISCIEIEEPNTHATDAPAQKFLMLICYKP